MPSQPPETLEKPRRMSELAVRVSLSFQSSSYSPFAPYASIAHPANFTVQLRNLRPRHTHAVWHPSRLNFCAGVREGKSTGS
jgi:hypothetical protein